MLRSLYAAVSGLRNHQTRMDVIGNNIANVNTTGFKASRVIFSDIYSQTLQPAAAGTATTGGSNPQQVGLGVTVASIDVLMTRAGSQYTGATLDMAIEGDGFFIVNDGSQEFYTRAGNFTLDSGNRITLNGNLVQGYMMDNTTTPPTQAAALSAIDTTGYTNVSIDKNGNVTGLDATNNSVVIAKVGLATFSNQNGLEKAGDSLYTESSNSGAAVYGTPGTGAAGTLNAGSLEMSNVDLSKEFTDMITTQRGFQANSRVITTSDTLLEELVNLKR